MTFVLALPRRCQASSIYDRKISSNAERNGMMGNRSNRRKFFRHNIMPRDEDDVNGNLSNQFVIFLFKSINLKCETNF